jgi:hypothetical protein
VVGFEVLLGCDAYSLWKVKDVAEESTAAIFRVEDLLLAGCLLPNRVSTLRYDFQRSMNFCWHYSSTV